MLKATNFRFSKSLTPRMPSEMGAGWAILLLGLSMMLSAALVPIKRLIRRIEAKLVYIWAGYRTYGRDLARMAWLCTAYCLITGTGLAYALTLWLLDCYHWFVTRFVE